MKMRLLCLVIGYVFGCFQTSYIYGRRRGVDIRKLGSGNAGTTNALRNFGTRAGLTVFAGDCAKCVLAVLLVWLCFRTVYPASIRLYMVYTGFGCILGHNYPFYMQFKGGKGIAVTAGLIATFGLPMVPICLAAFFIPVLVTHYISLGSLTLNVVFFVTTVILGQKGMLMAARNRLAELYLLVFLIGCLAFWRHRENIKNLLAGKERKTYLFKKK